MFRSQMKKKYFGEGTVYRNCINTFLLHSDIMPVILYPVQILFSALLHCFHIILQRITLGYISYVGTFIICSDIVSEFHSRY